MAVAGPPTLYTSMQRILSSKETSSKLLVDVCDFLSLSLDDLYDVSLKGWKKPLAHGLNEPRCVWAMEWLLKRLKSEDETAETFRKNPLAWNVLYYLIQVLYPKKTHSLMVAHKFTKSLLEALLSLSDQNTANVPKCTDGSADVDQTQIFRNLLTKEGSICLSTVISCDLPYNGRPGRSDGHAGAESGASLGGSSIEEHIRRSPGHRAFASISQVLLSLQNKYINEDKPLFAKLSLAQILFRGEEATAMTRLLGPSMVAFYRLIRTYDALVDKISCKANLDIDLLAPFIKLWQSESDLRPAAYFGNELLMFLQANLKTCLRLKSSILTLSGEGAQTATRYLDEILESTLIRQFRDSFTKAESRSTEDSENAKMVHEAICSCLTPATLDTTVKTDQEDGQVSRRRVCAYFALPGLFELACKTYLQTKRNIMQRNYESNWLLAFLRRLVYGLGVDTEGSSPHVSLTAADITQSHQQIFTDLLRVASNFDLRLGDRSILRCMACFGNLGNGSSINWAVVRACVTNCPGLLFSTQGANATETVNNLANTLREASANALQYRSLNGSLPEDEAYAVLKKPHPTCDDLVRGFLLPLIELYVQQKRQCDFFPHWRNALNGGAPDSAVEDDNGLQYCLMADERLIDAVSQGVREEHPLALLQRVITGSLRDIGEGSKKASCFVAVIQLECFINALVDGRRKDLTYDHDIRLTCIREVLQNIGLICTSQSAVHSIFEWRLWRILARTVDAAVRVGDDFTSLSDISILAKVARKNVSKAFQRGSCNLSDRQKCLFSLRCLLSLYQLGILGKPYANKNVEKELLKVLHVIEEFMDQKKSRLSRSSTQHREQPSGSGVLDVLDSSTTCLLALLVIHCSGFRLPDGGFQYGTITDFICSTLISTVQDQDVQLGFQWALSMLARDRDLCNNSEAIKALRQSLLNRLVHLKNSDIETKQTIELMNVLINALLNTGIQSSKLREREAFLRSIRDSKSIEELVGQMTEEQRLPHESLVSILDQREAVQLYKIEGRNEASDGSGVTDRGNSTHENVTTSPLELVQGATGLLREMNTANLIEISTVLPKLKKLKLTAEDRAGKVESAMHTLMGIALDMMRGTQLLKHFIIASRVVWSLLGQQAYVPTQFDIDNVLSCIRMRTSETGIALSAESAHAAFTCMTRVLGVILSNHIAKIGGRYHILVPALQGLLRCLFARYEGRNAGIEQPAWLVGSPKNQLPDSACADSLTRIITSICDPSVAAAQGGSSRRAMELNDSTKKAKRLAGQSMYILIIEYCRCMLRGSLEPDVRAALEPGIYSILDAMSRDMRANMMATMTQPEVDIYKPMHETWVAARKN